MSTCPCCLPTAVMAVLAGSVIFFVTAKMIVSGLFGEKKSVINTVLTYIIYFITFLITIFAIILGILQLSKDLRSFVFSKILISLSHNPDMINLRCGHVGNNISGRVLEYGPGPGANFKCWAGEFAPNPTSINITEWVGLEPNSYFAEPMIAEKDRLNLNFPVSVTWEQGENVALQSNSFDVVIATHVLCSVTYVDAMLSEIARVLKPGGKYIFLEHVETSTPGDLIWWQQQLVAPILGIVGNGCAFKSVWRNIERNFPADNFIVELKHIEAPIGMKFLSPHIVGQVTKK